MSTPLHAWLHILPLLFLPLGATARESVLIDAAWRFHAGEAAGAEAPAFSDAGWRRLDLPHDWSIEGRVDVDAPSTGPGGYFPTGVVWYRRNLDVPAAWMTGRVWIEFEGVHRNSEVWLNGVSLGRQPYGYSTFLFELTPHLRCDAPNVLAVRVDNAAQPSSRWYNGTGIYRHVRLHAAGPVHVPLWGVFATTLEAGPEQARLRVRTTVRNTSGAEVNPRVETRVLGPDGREVGRGLARVGIPAGGEALAEVEIAVKRPLLWSPESPALHRIVTRVRHGLFGTADTVETFCGLRTVRVSAERGFELNGRSLELNGANVHHDNGPLGAASFDRAEERKVRLLKAAGFNAVRTAHNPPAPAFLDACDRLGLLVMEESFDGWGKAKNPHDYSVWFKDWWPRDIDAMVLRDRNHPSVVIWSSGNEVIERGSPEGAEIARNLAGRIRALDDSRPVAAGINGVGEKAPWTDVDGVFAALDIAGYNYEIRRHADDHARLPGRVIVSTESERSTAFAHWAAAADQPYVIGDFVWSGIDYLGEAGIGRVFPPGDNVIAHWKGPQWPWHGAACGDIDLTGWRKPSSHYRSILWNAGGKLHAVVLEPAPDGGAWGLSQWAMPPARPSWTWTGLEGRPLQVEVYSRHERVRLFLNGKLLGEQPTGREQEFKARFSVRYAPGELKAVGVDRGRETGSFVLKTTGPAARLRITVDRSTVAADGQDLVYATVRITDAHGAPVMGEDRAVEYAVEGQGTLAGIASADATTREPYFANPRRTYQGRALVVLRTTRTAGTLKLSARAEGLSPDSATIETR